MKLFKGMTLFNSMSTSEENSFSLLFYLDNYFSKRGRTIYSKLSQWHQPSLLFFHISVHRLPCIHSMIKFCSILEHLSDPSRLLHSPSSRLNSDPYQLCLDPKEIVLKANNIDDFTHLLKSSTGPVFMESNPHFFLEYPKSVWTWTGCLSSSPPSGTLPSTPHTLMPLCFFTYVLAASNALHSQHFYNPEVIPHPTLSAWLLLFLQDSDPMSSCKSSLVSLNGVETPFSMLPYSIT